MKCFYLILNINAGSVVDQKTYNVKVILKDTVKDGVVQSRSSFLRIRKTQNQKSTCVERDKKLRKNLRNYFRKQRWIMT